MRNVSRALFWAAAMICLAVGSAAGIVEQHTAQTMLIVIPALAIATLRNNPCPIRRSGRRA